MRLVIALGGNAMTGADGSARPEDQRQAVEAAAEPIAQLVTAGHELLLTHGNGPQVGNLLVKNELAAAVVPPVPLDWCGAQTQATIGVLLLNALDRALAARQSTVRTATLVSRTLVDAADPGFTTPSKPIGRYLSAAEAEVLIAHGQYFEDRGERGWRRMVASPEPVACLDSPAAVALLAAGFVVVSSGGGGVPVIRTAAGTIAGVEAVIDKDLTAAVLAEQLEADVLIIATDVPHVVLGWGGDHPRPLGEVTVAELRQAARRGEFAGGSMGPKVEAVCRFTERTGRPAMITALADIAQAAAGTAGTRTRAA
ncbi:carbamate kinase [Jatrophihabitans telluris]|uniref:Carbamate kinase n=1 Tax=Jatrophihabitans telluris TaxID=2038343 RepID=A0ABY4R5E1_9ACTN|nr:carbamate kinase [Jatrophihabitans telluris]UQX90090.1 carbamate kinase [Jatrophihabitans telluris]